MEPAAEGGDGGEVAEEFAVGIARFCLDEGGEAACLAGRDCVGQLSAAEMQEIGPVLGMEADESRHHEVKWIAPAVLGEFGQELISRAGIDRPRSAVQVLSDSVKGVGEDLETEFGGAQTSDRDGDGRIEDPGHRTAGEGRVFVQELREPAGLGIRLAIEEEDAELGAIRSVFSYLGKTNEKSAQLGLEGLGVVDDEKGGLLPGQIAPGVIFIVCDEVLAVHHSGRPVGSEGGSGAPD